MAAASSIIEDHSTSTTTMASSNASPTASAGATPTPQPASPSLSIAGSELSFVSDAESTDSIATPPTSPTRAQEVFRRSIDAAFRDRDDDDVFAGGRRVSASSASASGSSSSRTSSLNDVFASLKLGGTHSQAQADVTPNKSSGISPRKHSLPPTTTTSTSPVRGLGTPLPLPAAPATPSRTRPAFVQSLSAKRAHQSPGLLDLSSVPKFPSFPPAPAAAENNKNLNASAATTPGASSPSGSTPRALLPKRPGLLSRWSTDSESGSGSENGSGSGSSSCTSDECPLCSTGDGDGDEDESEQLGSDEDENEIEEGPRSSMPAALFPPAPKPHQHGFSPLADAAPASSYTLSPLVFDASPLPSPADSPPSHIKPPSRKSRSTAQVTAGHRHRHGHGHRHHHHHRVSDSGHESSSSSSSSPFPALPAAPRLDGSSGSSSSPKIVEPSKPLTRSQGLRIRDDGAKPRSRWAGRSVSQQLALATASNTTTGAGAAAAAGGAAAIGTDGESSGRSPIKTAAALIDGTISPAATTTDPLRVKLREMPGAITPDGLSSFPSSSSGSSSTLSPSAAGGLPASPSPCGLSVHQRALFAMDRPRSPLHISSFPGWAANRDLGTNTSSGSGSGSAGLFARNYSLAPAAGNSGSPMRSPLSSRTRPDHNPYFAGFA